MRLRTPALPLFPDRYESGNKVVPSKAHIMSGGVIGGCKRRRECLLPGRALESEACPSRRNSAPVAFFFCLQSPYLLGASSSCFSTLRAGVCAPALLSGTAGPEKA